MNKQFSREEVQKILSRWHQLRNQFGDQAINVPEFAHLSKIIKFLQQQNQNLQKQQQQQQQTPQTQQPQPGAGQNDIQFQPQQTQGQRLGPQTQAYQGQPRPVPSADILKPQTQIGQRESGVPGMVPGSVNQNDSTVGARQDFYNNANVNGHNMGVVGTPQGLSQQQQEFKFKPNKAQQPTTHAIENAVPSESAFTAQQFQLVKAQYQALKYLLKTPGSAGPPVPQNLVEFVTNQKSAFATGPFLVSQSQQGRELGSESVVQDSNNARSSISSQSSAVNTNNAMTMNMQNNFNNNNQNYNISTNDKPFPTNGDAKMSVSEIQAKGSKGSTPSDAQVVPSTAEDDSITKEIKEPTLFSNFVKENERAKSDIVKISNPNVQVDCFEFPDIASDMIDEVSFTALYAPQNRFQYPSMLPEGIDMGEIANNREITLLLKIEGRIDMLKQKLQNMDPNDKEEEFRTEAELRCLELLPYQKQLKGKLSTHLWFSKSLLPNSHPNFLAKFGSLSIDDISITDDLYKRQLYSLAQEQNQKHQTIINQILTTRNDKFNRLSRRKDKVDKIRSKINSFHNQTAREEQKKLERMAKQRLQALKSNDEEAYLKLLDHTKDTRITHLLKQTNQFLDSLAHAVQVQQRESQDKQSSNVNDSQNLGEEMTDEKREKVDYYHVAHRIKEEVTIQPSILIGGTLKEYQIKGLQWMVSLFNNHLNGILADEMGLGKTIQTISLITYLVEVKRIPGPFLVIVPLSTLTNWNIEFDKWAPAVKKITYKGTPNQRKALQYDVRSGNFQILLTTFEYVIKDKNPLARVKWVHMIIDEGHRMKNATSKLSETLTHHYHSDNRLILTGTPLQNNLPELWALLNFVLPKIFNSVKSFDEWFNTPFANTGSQDKIELSEEETLLVIRRLHKVLRPFLLRRLKKDVEKDLPNKVEKVVKCKMSSLQSKLYQQMLRYNVLFASDPDDETVPVTIKNANNQIMQLRKICNHPFVYEEVENLINPTVETNDKIWRVAGKFELLDKILPKFKKTGHRVLIFFQMTQIMDIMEDFLRLRGLKYMRLDGSTKADDRTGLLKLFNAENSEYFCFLLSTRAGGLGLNLQTADTVIIFDTDWNPHQDLQAQDRAHRIGQKNEVRILRLITEDSVEEMILERAHAKLEIDGKVIQAGKFDNKSTAEEQEALLRALLEKEEERRQKGSVEEKDELDDDELNQVISRNDDELILFRKLDEERANETRLASYATRLYNEQELPEIYRRDPEEFLKTDEILSHEYGRGSRERNTTFYDDNLTEEQWLRQIDGVISDGSDNEGESGPKKKRSRNRKRASKIKEIVDEESGRENSPVGSDDDASISSKRKAQSELDGSERGAKKQRSSTPKTSGKGKSRSRNNNRNKTPILNRTVPSIDPLTSDERSRLQKASEAMYETIINHENEHGRKLSDLFLVKPSKKHYPDYYVLIKQPIALDVINKRITTKCYTQIREVLEDIHLMFSNARIYNEEGSIVYEDATELERIVIKTFFEVCSDIKEKDQRKILDFAEFDSTYSLKPMPANVASQIPPQGSTKDLSEAEELQEDDEGQESGNSSPESMESE